ncbi:hypothetical protein PC129_g11994 [Phytophthora cactorum]|uniref:PH domain-containing protein n=1 Tax=Phytophthora cactorum TaxID=29920 RepID=A0A329SAF7_9STRA|nr:hypothetical protein Pcac1_g7773 [Phytophthora cactorum]KAG2817373.1 hypothetical protein PC111_g12725 [Phytophthora cactorum]KAG2824768.1 hypothetical protein PC112_g9980 [Phytophthora cactorum]KAG2860960.1 hypothetical protein PC113_g7609 [Phytophthora cactorum]KAG2915119.1 hypothetical protein PC114_g7944 [Phytophthora cactorum]
MPSAPDYCGWGAKQGSKVRTWKNRYFVLHGRELVYYSGAKSDGSGTGVGEKGRLKVVNVDYSPDRKNGLFIHGEGKDLKMTTASAQESRVLFRKIKEVIGEQETSFRMSTPQTQQKMIKKTVEKEGWLLKEEPQLQAWKRSYVMLSGRTVEFCAHRNAAPVDSLTLMKVEADETSPLSLGLVARGGRVAHVAAETREEIEDWDRALAAAIGQPLALRQVTKIQEELGNQEMMVSDTDLVARKYSTVACEGWLEKLGQHSKTWKKRYMSLANGMLEYRKGPMEQLSAELYVADVRYSIEYSNALEIEFGSDKALANGDTICVRAESMRELDKWMIALCDAVGKPRLQPAGVVSEPPSPSGIQLSEDRQGKPQLPPFPRNVLHSQDSDKSSSNTQPSTPANTDRSSGNQVTVYAATNRIKRGWLYEQGDVTSSWKLQYFVLNGNTLHHCKHVNGTSETLGSVSSVTRNHETTGSLCIQFEDGSTLNVYGETKADTDAWYAALCKASWSSAENPPEGMSVSNQEEEVESHEDNGFRGWLLKKGQNFKTWKRRYFVLESSRLVYSTTADSEVLGSGVVFDVDVGDLRPFCLSIRFQNGRLLHVVAPTAEAFSKWFDVLRRASNLAESFLSQSNGKVVFDEEFDNDINENANDVDVEFTEEDLAEYEMSLRDGEGASLWIAAMQNKPEYDALSSSASEQGDQEVAVEEHNSTELFPRASEAPSASLNGSQGCVGWLKKEGGNVKSWKRRYFTLYGSKLSYYKSDKGSLLRSFCAVNIEPHPSISLGLIVSTVGGRKLVMQADSKDEFDRWLGAIHGAVAGDNERKSTVVEAPTMNVAMENRSSEDLKAFVSHSGWLQKEGQRFKTWKRRYFTLKNSALIYYSEIGGVARGHGMVKGALQDTTKPLTLVIEFLSGKTMRVTAASETEMNSWLQALSRGRASSSTTTAVSDISDDIVDSESEDEDRERAARISRFNSNDYINDTITNDTIMRLRDEEGKGTMLESRVGAINTSRSFKGELTFDEEEEKEDMGLSTTGADYYRQLLAEDERVQQQRSEEKLAKGEPPITGCAPCCTVM